MNPDENVHVFVRKLLAEQGIDQLEMDVDVKAQLESDLAVRVHDRINAMIVAEMPADKHEEFETLLDSGKEEDVQAFCKTTIPDLEERIAQELLVFRNAYLGIA